MRNEMWAAVQRSAVLLAWVLAAGLGATALARADGPPTAVVHTASGDVRGIVANGAGEFLGIPYAQPPVGPLRWQPPQPASAWQGVRQATLFGNTCPQPQRGVFASPSRTEDCLYLNVFTPSFQPHAATLPVMVWFYGGGLFSGESNDYDASKLARRGGVVVVTLNFRVGALGFLSQPALNAEGHPAVNYGIMDQQAALGWVRKNIAGFGGNAKNVTIFGQSGGGTAVMANLQSPLSKGLFQRAINESGTRIAVTPPQTMLKIGRDFATAAGCADQSAACLRALSVEQVLANQAGVLRVVSDFPSVDGTVITHPAFEAFSKGLYNHVPILTGLVQDEQAFFLPEANTHVPLSADDVRRFAASFGAAHTEALLRKYPLEKYESPSLAEIAMARGAKACTARSLDLAWMTYAPVYAYQFNDRTAPSYFPPLSYPMRAYHTSELQFLFPLFHGGQGVAHALSPAQERLSDIMVDEWTSFARAGTPNRAGLPEWPKYSVVADNVEILNLPAPTVAHGYGRANDCAFWDPILAWK